MAAAEEHRATFCPLIVTVEGIAHQSLQAFLRRIAARLSAKWLLVRHASWWPDGYQSMTLCLRTVGPADWSPEEARSEARRSGDWTSAGAAAALRGRLFFLLHILSSHYCCTSSFSSQGQVKKMFFARGSCERRLSFFLSFFSSMMVIVVLVRDLCSLHQIATIVCLIYLLDRPRGTHIKTIFVSVSTLFDAITL